MVINKATPQVLTVEMGCLREEPVDLPLVVDPEEDLVRVSPVEMWCADEAIGARFASAPGTAEGRMPGTVAGRMAGAEGALDLLEANSSIWRRS